MSLRVALVWRDQYGNVELASTIDPKLLREVKKAALRKAKHMMASNEGFGEVQETKYRLEYEKLQEMLDYVLPPLRESDERRIRRELRTHRSMKRMEEELDNYEKDHEG